MRGKPHKRQPRTTTPHAQPQLLLRALVGSLVFCASLGATNAPARAVDQYGAIALVRASSVFRPNARQIAHARGVGVAIIRAQHARRDATPAPALNNMLASASGKQLSLWLGATRERAGNLLRQNLALP
jgi:hypothetical protein